MRYARLQASEALGQASDADVKKALNTLLDFNRPKVFNPDAKDNILVLLDKSYKKTVFSLAENNIPNSEKLTMFEFRTAIELLKERNDKIKADSDKMKGK